MSKGGARYKDAHIKNRRGYWVGFIKESTWGRGGGWTTSDQEARAGSLTVGGELYLFDNPVAESLNEHRFPGLTLILV